MLTYSIQPGRKTGDLAQFAASMTGENAPFVPSDLLRLFGGEVKRSWSPHPMPLARRRRGHAQPADPDRTEADEHLRSHGNKKDSFTNPISSHIREYIEFKPLHDLLDVLWHLGDLPLPAALHRIHL